MTAISIGYNFYYHNTSGFEGFTSTYLHVKLFMVIFVLANPVCMTSQPDFGNIGYIA